MTVAPKLVEVDGKFYLHHTTSIDQSPTSVFEACHINGLVHFDGEYYNYYILSEPSTLGLEDVALLDFARNPLEK